MKTVNDIYDRDNFCVVTNFHYDEKQENNYKSSLSDWKIFVGIWKKKNVLVVCKLTRMLGSWKLTIPL